MTALLVDACRSKKARRQQLIVLNWAVRSERCVDSLAAFLNSESTGHDVGVRYEPALVRAVNIAVGSGVLAVEGDWLHLTEAGESLVGEIVKQDLYERERMLLDRLPKPLSFSAAEQILKGGA